MKLMKNVCIRASKITHGVNVLATKPDSLSLILILGMHRVGENPFLQVAL